MSLIHIPYVPGMLRAATQQWGEANGAHFTELESDDESYYRAFHRWWSDPEPGDLIIVEQDILPPLHAIESMFLCPDAQWCACWYHVYPTFSTGRDLTQPVPFGMGLGCTRFSARLRREYPELADRAGEPLIFGPEPDPDPPRCWWVMDMRIGMHLMRSGHLPHDHGKAKHLP